MGFSQLRLEDINLFNYIKYEVLGFSFIERLENQPLVYNTQLGMYLPSYSGLEPSPVSNGRGWVLFDEISGSVDVSQEQVSRVSVVGASSYDVNYLLGGIKNPNTIPTSVSYYWNYVSVIDGWPGTTPPPLPIVSVDMTGGGRTGYQLGGGYLSNRTVSLHIFATGNGERDDLTETLFSSLYNRSIPMKDYRQGDYLDYDGFYDANFTGTILNSKRLFFENVSYRVINLPLDWADLNQYRSIITFDMISYM